MIACSGVKGVGAGIGEELVVNLLVGVVVLVLNVEEAGHACSVVGADEVEDDTGQVLFLCHPQTLGDVADDNLRALCL